jgi:hypothetical protein
MILVEYKAPGTVQSWMFSSNINTVIVDSNDTRGRMLIFQNSNGAPIYIKYSTIGRYSWDIVGVDNPVNEQGYSIKNGSIFIEYNS